uniref:Small ribosomal subunit protein bS18c n=1 Tax=Cuscuta japonica TaxID=81913 RepID=A0A2Z5UCK0_CUSJA|nr:ribosomal protein S18 [Cuscuta japonica]
MKLIRGILFYADAGFSRKFCSPQVIRTFSTNPRFDNFNLNQSPFEPANQSEQRPFGDTTGKTPTSNSFYQELDKAERDYNRSFQGFNVNSENRSTSLDGLDDSINTLSDGMDSRLKEAATYFEFDLDEVNKEDYSFRKDVTFFPGNTYDIKDLDLRKPGVQKPMKRPSFQTTTEEVLQKADFRNVRFLANFITDAGIIIKRSSTKISAKAQRKVAREIKTARAFGLLPFTTMGTKHFVFGRTMESLDDDYSYESHYSRNFVDTDASVEPLE